MGMQASSFVLLYASLARAPEFAMTLAGRMAATAHDQRDGDSAQRWARCYLTLHDLYGDDTLGATGPRQPLTFPTSSSAAV
jgi:hypothetical protein